ncbi:Heterokaryon incompatibility protein 6, OR allele [Beauveria bassiana D1-5]|uniref:Heterokaryon incompatibility protein 6, OR allele n=1 Tax=Beauveria bassiana D1-5 TaxID=1245745 RepID=A0A0A2VQ54_BEABA|nr:Heterokaryon incompatibility protein 6, OR allele [Beauveria bassiana D1-5]
MRSIYKQLGQGETIRVLKIARSVAQIDQLYGSLQVVKLQERPKYQALSYVWGPRGQHDPSVLIDNCPFQISTSLFQAFLKLTIGASPVTLWVDQICINQLDNAEKQQQVRLMSRVYQQADQVICWLGVQENNSDIAFKLLRILNLSDGMYEAYNDLVAGGYARSPADLFRPSNTLGKAVALLFQRSWFERLWIVQEVALANRVLVHCGACSMEGQLFFEAADKLFSLVSDPPEPRLQEPFHRACKLKDIREQVTAQNKLSLPHLAQTLSSWRCENEVDRLNALLGIAFYKNPTDAWFIAQYSLPSAESFMKFATDHIRNTGSLEILHFAGCGDYDAHVLSSNGQKVCLDMHPPADDIATWAPDWRIESRPLPLLTSPGNGMTA